MGSGRFTSFANCPGKCFGGSFAFDSRGAGAESAGAKIYRPIWHALYGSDSGLKLFDVFVLVGAGGLGMGSVGRSFLQIDDPAGGGLALRFGLVDSFGHFGGDCGGGEARDSVSRGEPDRAVRRNRESSFG